MKQGRSLLVSVALLGVVLLVSLVLMSAATLNSTRFDHLFSALVLIQVLGLLLFTGLIVMNFRALARRLRAGETGSRLTVRLVTILVGLAVVPAIVIYSFSLDFLRRGVDSWFDVEIETSLDNALELSRYALDLRMRQHLAELEQAAAQITAGDAGTATLDLSLLRSPDATVISNNWDFGAPELDRLREDLGAEELVMLSREGRLLGASSVVGNLVPAEPPGPLMLQLRQGRSYIALEPLRDKGLVIQAGVGVRDPGMGEKSRVLFAVFPVSKRPSELASNIQAAFAKYDKLVYLREQLKLSFTLVLTMVLLFSLTSAVLAAFYLSHRLAAPLRRLAAGTRAIADGDYSHEIAKDTRDDFGVLVDSFNEMTRKLRHAQSQARVSRQALEQQHAYLSTVLGSLTSGVITLTHAGVLRTSNAAADQILGVPLAPFLDRSLKELETQHAFLEPFVESLGEALVAGHREWEQETVFFGRAGRQHVMCRGARLPAEGTAGDYVLVFDDLTGLVKGQRDAAWSEVARRLAHEIKNPLTPIQLSAERLRHKYLANIDPDQRETFERLTSTIVQQVEAMKRMVNTFSDFARPALPELENVELNPLVEAVVDLYRQSDPEPTIELSLADELPMLTADSSRLRQVLANVVKNAIEAHPAGTTPQLAVSTRELVEEHLHYIEIDVRDAGNGISSDLARDLFEPYITNKDRGTGLGLAIVKKIVEEHGGVVALRNNEDAPGATATIRLPVAREDSAADDGPTQRAV